MSKKITTTTPPTAYINKEQGWHRNTDICVNVKTILRNDIFAKLDKTYAGLLTHDQEDHYTFVETIRQNARKRNPQVFNGKFITITRRSDGTYHPNFKPVNIGPGFNTEAYNLCVYLELRRALKGLVEKVK